ncbi:AMP-binding protein, partial [Psychrobacter sp. TB20-MNA-CIBAN-0197]|uniref:AMP-binding protein n=1 Tax=Psychrobacter sp. TB20-MNA-CIBAN-0197 TaxID=3140453 RepID=UPI00333079CA
YAVALLGCLRAGAVLVNVNPMYTHYELAHQLTDSQACGLIVLDGMTAAYDQLDEEFDNFDWDVALYDPLPEFNWVGATGFFLN